MAEKTSSTSSVFAPWGRRFTDEHERELKETRALYDEVKTLHEGSPYAKGPSEIIAFTRSVYAKLPDQDACKALEAPLCEAIFQILLLEPQVFEFPEWKEPLSLSEGVDLRRFLRAKKHFLSRPEYRDLLQEITVQMVSAVADKLPKTLAPSPFVLPLLYTLPNPPALIENIFACAADKKLVEAGLFVELVNQYCRNLAEMSGMAPTPETFSAHAHKLKTPTKAKLPLPELCDYVKATPLYDLFQAPVPLRFTQEDRFSHMHILGGSGAGKTTLLQNLILHDLHSDPAPSLVIVDSQGDMIGRLTRLAQLKKRRVLLISPRDIHHPPAINIFDVKRLGDYGEADKEKVTAGVIQTFDYLFTGLLGAELTPKQSVFFRYVARLMLSLPQVLGRNATILDIIRFIDQPEDYRSAVETLPELQRSFFERDLLDAKKTTFKETKEQVRYRLQAILENPTLARLFTSKETKVDLFAELNRGSVILVDTDKDFLKDASAVFGRIVISLVLQAILERSVIPEAERYPAFLYADEAAEYFDTNIDDLLTQVRKFRMGCVFAHQFLDQASPQLRASLAANTAIKFAGGVSVGDARTLAADMRTSADFITGQPGFHFAAYIRNVTPSAVSIPVEKGRMEKEPRLTEAEHEAFLDLNRGLVSVPKPEANPQASASSPATASSEASAPASPPRPAATPTRESTPKDDLEPGEW